MAQRGADGVTGGTDRAGHRRVGLAQRDQGGAEVDRQGGDVERVDAVHHPVGPAVAQELGDPRQSRVVHRPDPVAAEQDRLGHSLGAEALGRGAHPRPPSHNTICPVRGGAPSSDWRNIGGTAPPAPPSNEEHHIANNQKFDLQ
jgi:hypothetical protein